VKTLFLMLWVLAGSALAQTAAPPTAPLAPELAPLAAKHQADLGTIEKQRAGAIAPYLPAYFTRLDAEEKNALNHGDIEAVAALRNEREVLKAGRIGELIASPWPEKFPATLKSSRDSLFDNYKRIDAQLTAARHKVDADYLRALDGLQFQAAANPEVARQIKAESDAVLGNPVTTAEGNVEVQAKAGKVVNADFTQIDSRGVPVGWKLDGHGFTELQIVPAGTTFSLVKENAHFFLHMSRTKSKGSAMLVQFVEVRRGAREMELSLLYRGESGTEAAPAVGFRIFTDQGEGRLIAGTKPTDFGTSWKELAGKVNLQNEKGIKSVRIKVGDESKGTSTGNFDFEKLVVKFK
jgi:hypothetical protein